MDLPKVREDRPEQCAAQILHTGRSTRPGFRAYDPLDRLHVPVAPLLHALVNIDEGVTDVGRRSRIVIDLGQQRPDTSMLSPDTAPEWQMSKDGRDWTRDFGLTYTRGRTL